jgi:excinuclease ABC subunit C
MKGFIVSELFGTPHFHGFGPDHLRPDGDSPSLEWISATKRSELRMRVLQLCPPWPGVYGMLDRAGTLLYIGKAKSLRTRVLSYFRRKNRDERAARIMRHTRTVLWEPTSCEFAALIRELELIGRWRPRFNVQGVPDRERWVYLCLGRKPAPFAHVVRETNGKEVAVFGPLKGRYMAHEAARRINDLFQLRDCPRSQTMQFADQGELFPIIQIAGCLRYEVQTCLGPCAKFTTQNTYSHHVRRARDFLDGKDLSVIQRLEDDMLAAAAAMHYERAAAIRDKLQPLLWLQQRLNGLVRAREQLSFVYKVRSYEEIDLWLLIHRGRAVKVIPAPRSDEQAKAALPVIESTYFGKGNRPVRQTRRHIDHVLVVSGWFRRRPEELAKTMSPELALAMCGGPALATRLQSAG